MNFDGGLDNLRNYIIFGAGNYGQSAYEYLQDKVNIVAFSDDNSDLWGEEIGWGIKCINPSIIPEYGDECVVILATMKRHWDKMIKELNELKVNWVTFDNYVYSNNNSLIKKIEEEYFIDEFSKKVYRSIIEYRSDANNLLESEIITDNVYFCLPQFRADYNERCVFIDAGAFVGDTTEQFLMNQGDAFHKIYAFEPGEKQFAALKERVKRLNVEWALDEGKIVLERAALSDRKGFCQIINAAIRGGDHISISDEGGIPIYALDEHITESITFIKADVEGSELALLKGARNAIKKYKPKMAVCLYHRPFDFFEIPEYIKSLVPEYKMAVRHHSISFEDTVLYCWI